MPKYAISKICTAFDGNTIGSKVVDVPGFLAALDVATASYDSSKDDIPGQHRVILPEAVYPMVTSGVGRRAGRNPEDFVVREHRGRCDAYLLREFAEPTTGIMVVLDTLDAYMADPDVTPEEVATIQPGTTHVIVAVLAFAGPEQTYSPYRFVHNLAGGNNEALAWKADEIRSKAILVKSYDDAWCVVADPRP